MVYVIALILVGALGYYIFKQVTAEASDGMAGGLDDHGKSEK